jgi:hypothetical protein
VGQTPKLLQGVQRALYERISLEDEVTKIRVTHDFFIIVFV